MKSFEGAIIAADYTANLYQISLTPDGDMMAFYNSFGGPDDDDYPAFVKFDTKTGAQKMAYWYNVSGTEMESSYGTVDKDGNIWITGYSE
jgi:hypothetical protein